MSTELIEIKQAVTATRVMQQTVEDVSKAVAVMVQTVFVCAGQTPERSDIAMLTREITHDLATRYKTLTLAEVKIALDNGVRGNYGDYFGINVVSINKWLKAYIESDERRQALQHNQPALPPATKSTPSTDEIQALMQAAYSRCRTLFDATGTIRDFGNAVYDWLDAQGLIHLTPDEKREIYETAHHQLLAEAKANLYNATEATRPARQYTVQAFEEHAQSHEQRIVSHAKRLALARVWKR